MYNFALDIAPKTSSSNYSKKCFYNELPLGY